MADKSKTVTATAKKTVVKLADEKPTDPATTELAEDAPTDELSEEDKDAEIADLKKQLADALAKLAEKDSAMKLAEEEAQGTKCETLVSDAIKARKITLAQKSKFLTLAKADFKTTEELIKDLPVATSVKEALVTGDKNKDTKLVELSAKDWDELFKTPGAVDFLKLNSPDTYKEKFKAKFGTEPRNL